MAEEDSDLDPTSTFAYLTESEDESDDETSMNFYKFICTQSQRNNVLRTYLWDVGFFDPEDFIIVFPSLPEVPQEIYDLLDKSGKRTMKYQYLSDVRKLTKIPTFTFIDHA
jgi:hypothetical protein